MSEHVYSLGDWVTITGRIVEFHPNSVDLGVEVFSKTDQYVAFVRRDPCAPTPKPIPAEPADASIATLEGIAYQRLTDHWYRAGRPERFTWVELNGLGDVEVIHHA